MMPSLSSLFDLYYFLFNTFNYAIIAYVAAINTVYFLMMILGFFAVRQYRGGLSAVEMRSLFRSSLLPSVSILAPAYNESATIRQSVRAMLGLNYPDHEVVVINDGSKDDTLQILIDEFHLYKSSRQSIARLHSKPIRAVYESREPIRLVVIDKENGGKSDSLNAGLNIARSDLVAAIDADSLLDSDALLQVVRPFLTDPEIVAVGGIVRVANGCRVEHGKVTRIALPKSWLARFQVVEYLRAFLGGRVAFSFLGSLLLISGAFGLFRRWAAIEAGGFERRTVGEDMELVVRLYHQRRKKNLPCRVVFIPDPVCWTEVPETLKTLQRQRNRWQRGTIESLWIHREMLLNPRFGVVGIVGMGYFAFFEALGPIVELLGYSFTLTGLAAGLIAPSTAALFFIVSLAFGVLLSVSAVLLEEFTLRRYPNPSDVLRLLAAAFLENFGYRQINTLWRVKGIVDAIRRKRSWGAMERRGFTTS
jgi:cellulose synthase/poly-beta-1,6-N-acetylglucosamine synthase-like glycosyltransferase